MTEQMTFVLFRHETFGTCDLFFSINVTILSLLKKMFSLRICSDTILIGLLCFLKDQMN